MIFPNTGKPLRVWGRQSCGFIISDVLNMDMDMSWPDNTHGHFIYVVVHLLGCCAAPIYDVDLGFPAPIVYFLWLAPCADDWFWPPSAPCADVEEPLCAGYIRVIQHPFHTGFTMVEEIFDIWLSERLQNGIILPFSVILIHSPWLNKILKLGFLKRSICHSHTFTIIHLLCPVHHIILEYIKLVKSNLFKFCNCKQRRRRNFFN